MGPVFDSRWELFDEYNTFEWNPLRYHPVTIYKNERNTNVIFNNKGALVVSIRGAANAHFLICKNSDYRSSFCYWIIIGGWGNIRTGIRRCPDGVKDSWYPPQGSQCGILRSKLWHNPLNPHEWKTFIITWNSITKTIKLYDPDKMILEYTDYQDTNYNEQYHVFFGNPEVDIPTQFRFHEYNYTSTNEFETFLISELLNINVNRDICIDMLVGLCAWCELHVKLMYNNGPQVIMNVISGAVTSEKVDHDLPMWQYARITATNLDENYKTVVLEIVTKSNKRHGNHWALSNVQQCVTEGTVKTLNMITIQDNLNGEYIWPNVTCQRLSYNQQHLGVISSIMDVITPPDNLTLCPESQIGPKCATFCDSNFKKNCEGAIICDDYSCYCSQGYFTENCDKQCLPGDFGYGCTQKCENCLHQDCNIYTGLCNSECKKQTNSKYQLIPPYCKDAVESPELQYDQIDETTLRIYFPKVDNDNKFNITYEFEIQVNQIKWPKRRAEIGVDNDERPIYFTSFNNLKRGMKYNARISQRIKYNSNNNQEVIFDGDFSMPKFMCIWTEKFIIELQDKNLTIKKIDDEKDYPCPDDWYIVKVLLPIQNTDAYQSIDVTNSDEKFPITVGNLTPITNYVILINGMSSSFHYRRDVQTLVSMPSRVRKLKIDNVTSREVSISWLPSEEPNVILYGYELIIWALRHVGCRQSESVDFLYRRPYNIENQSQSYQIFDLIPYMDYKLTILAYHTRRGEENSINFTTNATKIPAATLENLSFKNNIITWNLPNVNCSTVTGPISATRLLFFGESEYVKDFMDYYDTEAFSFVLNKTKVQDIHGCERYRVRIYALREINGKYNESAFKELNFITNPQPPPRVINLTIVEVDYLNKTTLLRWKKPLPPTNGEIIKYNVIFIGYYDDKSEVITVYPHETCSLWEDSLCKTVPHPNQSRKTIQVSAVNKDVNEFGDVSEIIDRAYETEPDPPEKVFILKLEHGVVDIKWEHPFRTGGPMNEFKIKYEQKSTRLTKNLHNDKHNETINFPIDRSNYQKFYNTKLYLLPSTQYKIHIQGVIKRDKSELVGNSSVRTIETTSSFSWLNDKPSFKVNNESYSVKIYLPQIANNTRNNQVHIVIIGQLDCPNLLLVNERLARDIDIKDDEIAWHFGTFPTSRTSIVIGDNTNDALNCTLHPGRAYIIVIIVQEDNIAELERTKPLIWRSKSIQVGLISRELHEIWAVPLFIILIVAIGLTYYLTRKRKRIIKNENNIFIDVSKPMALANEASKNNHIKSPCHVSVAPRPDTVEYRESIMLMPAVTLGKLNPSIVTEEMYNKIKCTSLVKLNEFQDYVKHAIASGKLDEQYSFFPRGQMKPWEYGQLPENKRKNRYGNLIAYDETRVILEKLPDDPYSDYINANFIKGYKKNRAYIATQGPKPTTIIDFWRMVWQERVQVICMLANVMEGGKKKCEQYWPEIGKVMKYGNISVSNISHVQFADYTFRIFHIKCDGEVRKIDHLHYTAWPDHGIPLYTQSVVTYLKKLLATPSGNGPVLVHCSAGVGRTGTIILCDICLRRAAAEGVVDVFGETEDIRGQRANMVDNKQQYILAHVALVECLLSLPTAIPCNDSLPVRIQEYKSQLTLQQQRLEQSVWQDEALQSSERSVIKLSEKNMAKNRFPDLLPKSRLYIPRYPTSDDDSSYIFGVHVDSARRQNNFIASQLPLPTTVNDFWRMVAEFKVQLIIILQPPDINDPTCINFIPDPDEVASSAFLNLKGKAITDMKYCTQQKITLIDNLTKNSREQSVTVLSCKEWDPGRNKPPPKPVDLVELWQMAERISRNDEPTVVLCHDGVTGCGLYLALSFLLERMGLEHECDVCFAIRAIRRSRSDFCHTREQFEYLYDAAVIYAGYFETYANFT
ncbi:hypothetical protein PV328_009884 [Microctonus aethiopoides]|uniref:protein-tyrosine-phosphatase n=1 Tax=Microctonus aethiopoides TaxID=144406 RepID=A0AA39C6R6_9HYME|nr:hypothetical protein PV328_009884 [Microctonus aethiopoides]